MHKLFVGAVLLALSAGSGRAQEATTYIYDVHGRVVNVSTAATAVTGNISNYTYDSADNRTAHYSWPASRPGANYMASGHLMIAGQAIVSVDGQSRLELRWSGALVISCNGLDQLTLTGGNGAAGYLGMQSDGNLVLYSYVPAALWSTGTGSYPGAYLVMQDDGNAVLFSASSAPVWSSGTVC